jgi:hypothetical protein
MTPRECYGYARSLGLGSRYPAVREQAAASIRAMGSDAVSLLLYMLDAMPKPRMIARIIPVWILGFTCGIAVVLTAPNHHVSTARMLFSDFITFATGSSGYFLTLSRVRIFVAARTLLAEVADLRALNALLEGQQNSSKWRSTEYAKTIVKLLNEVKASDAPLLSESSRRRLVGVLDNIAAGEGSFTRDDISYYLAVLACLEQIGEVRALPSVAKIAKGENLSSYALPVRNAAREALPSFEYAVESQRVSGALLRPTEAPESAELLLRPAGTDGDDSAALLVRPAGGGEAPD